MERSQTVKTWPELKTRWGRLRLTSGWVPRLSREARGAKTGATENGREKERECYSGLGSESFDG